MLLFVPGSLYLMSCLEPWLLEAVCHLMERLMQKSHDSLAMTSCSLTFNQSWTQIDSEREEFWLKYWAWGPRNPQQWSLRSQKPSAMEQIKMADKYIDFTKHYSILSAYMCYSSNHQSNFRNELSGTLVKSQDSLGVRQHHFKFMLSYF